MRVRLEKQKTDNNLILYNKPERVYIPLISGNDKNITLLVNVGEYVYKGSMIAKSKGNFRIPIFSSVSGKVIDFKEKICSTGEKVKCVVIENDFKEKINNKDFEQKKLNEYTYSSFITVLKETGIVGLGGGGFPTYVKYESKNKKTLLVNAVECEPFETCDVLIAKTKCEEILETIDAIIEINKLDSAVIAIKKTNTQVKDIFYSFIGTYLKIKIALVDDYYPAGFERNLIKDVLNIEYKKLPIEKGIIVNNVSTIYAIYEALKYNKPLIERIVTFNGNSLKKKCNVLVKSGTLAKDVINYLGTKGGVIVSGGAMMGKVVSNDFVISSYVNCILNVKKEENNASACIKCGKCVSVCPSKLSPVLIMKTKKYKKLNAHKCIRCGLCTYICPAKIDVRGQVCLKDGERK